MCSSPLLSVAALTPSPCPQLCDHPTPPVPSFPPAQLTAAADTRILGTHWNGTHAPRCYGITRAFVHVACSQPRSMAPLVTLCPSISSIQSISMRLFSHPLSTKVDPSTISLPLFFGAVSCLELLCHIACSLLFSPRVPLLITTPMAGSDSGTKDMREHEFPVSVPSVRSRSTRQLDDLSVHARIEPLPAAHIGHLLNCSPN